MQLQARLGTEAIGLDGTEQLSSRDVDPAPARQKADANDNLRHEDDGVVDGPNRLDLGAGLIADQAQRSVKSRHDPNEL